MSLNYDIEYTKGNIVEMVETLTTCWKKKPEDVPGLDSEQLHKTVRRLLSEWSEKKSTSDYNFMALLIILRGCELWFSDDQFDDIECWLGIVSEAGNNNGWQENFTDEAVTTALKTGLKCTGEITISRDASGISIEYTQGDYGTGVHDGTVVLTNHALNLYNKLTPNIRTTYVSDLPSTSEEFAAALQSDDWDEIEINRE
eukprot:TRINITY_DN1246_c2_g1_i1.p1 TRINITY_DN1246_c2_g1~~TRINITY_DN1246_c2_g1_i1.p1  ORF type:complete len:200 (+),score=36.29 TRINITY_DN1246_c2_g1_i1:33-632(+)